MSTAGKSSAIEDALESLRASERELDADFKRISDELTKVRTAISALLPLVPKPPAVFISFTTHHEPPESSALPGILNSLTITRPPDYVGIEAAAVNAVRRAGRPLQIAEIFTAIDHAKVDFGTAPDPRKILSDLLWRRNNEGKVFERVGKGLYGLRDEMP